MFWTYVLKSEKYKKSYVGYTNNLGRRLSQHNAGQGKFTSKFGPWTLLYNERFENISDAIAREKFLKTKTGRVFLKNQVFK